MLFEEDARFVEVLPSVWVGHHRLTASAYLHPRTGAGAARRHPAGAWSSGTA